jgi:TRAP-type mannitol/chloroaromatic compound transport system substrate-binding protein
MSRQESKSGSPRRKFLRRAALAASTAAAGFPAVVKAQGRIPLRLQSGWQADSVFHEFALDYARKVNDMAGGDLRVEMLPADAVVPAFGLLDAVSKGALDGCHGVLNHHYSRHHAFSLWGSGPAFGMDANMLLAWHKYGGGRELLQKLYAFIDAGVTSFLYGPMPTQPLGWFKKPIAKSRDFKGLKFGTAGMSIDIFTGLGAQVNAFPADEIVQAMNAGLIDGAEFNNVTSDRALGLPGVSKFFMLQSYHQSAEQFEILFNKEKFDALPPKIRAIVANAVEAASADMSWKAMDRYSKDHVELQAGDTVRMLKTPDAVLRQQLASYDRVVSKRRQDDALFREIEQSQRRFAERAVRWSLDTYVSPRIAYDHYFRKKPAKKRRR